MALSPQKVVVHTVESQFHKLAVLPLHPRVPQCFTSILKKDQRQPQKYITAFPLHGFTVYLCTCLHLNNPHLDERAFLGMKAKSRRGKNSLGPMMPNPFVRFAWSLKGRKKKHTYIYLRKIVYNLHIKFCYFEIYSQVHCQNLKKTLRVNLYISYHFTFVYCCATTIRGTYIRSLSRYAIAYEDKDLNPSTGSIMPNHTETYRKNLFQLWEEPQVPAFQPEALSQFCNKFRFYHIATETCDGKVWPNNSCVVSQNNNLFFFISSLIMRSINYELFMLCEFGLVHNVMINNLEPGYITTLRTAWREQIGLNNHLMV